MSDKKSKTGTEEHQELMPLGDNNLDDRDLIHQMIGRHQMASSIAKLATVASLLDLQKIKENKLYKGLGNIQTSDGAEKPTWALFCKSIGTSARTVDEQLQNLKIFGPEAIDGINTMGVGVRQLRLLRELPEDELEQAKELAKSEDKEGLFELVEMQAIAKEKLKQEIEDADKSNKKQAKELTAAHEEIMALKEAQDQTVAGSEFPEHVMMLRKESVVLTDESKTNLLSLERLFERFFDQSKGLDDKKLKLHHNAAIYPALSNVASLAAESLELLFAMCERHGIDPTDIATFALPLDEGELEIARAAVNTTLKKRELRGEDRRANYAKSKAIKFNAGSPFKYLTVNQ